jgi:hypothetical protein
METLEGEVVSATDRVVMTSCKTKHGSSGGILIDAGDFTAIGLNTWGLPDGMSPLETLWQDDPKEPASELAGASLLHRAAWTQLPSSDFLKGSEHMAKFLDTARVLTIIYNTTPTKSGFKLKLDAPFAGKVTYRRAFDRYRRHPILGPVAEVNDKLGRAAESNIGVNTMEVVKTYSRAIQAIRKAYLEESAAIIRKTPPYYRSDMEQSGLIAFGETCHSNLKNAEDWFANKASLQGTMPVGTWFTLPPLSGFAPRQH